MRTGKSFCDEVAGLVAAEVAGVRERVWDVRERLGFVDWCEENLTLRKNENADYAGPYKRGLVIPMGRLWEEFMDAGAGGAWSELAVAKSSQSTCTFHALAAIARKAQEDPGNVVYAIHSQQEAANISDRLLALLEDSPGTAGVLEAMAGDDKAAGRIKMPEMTAWLVGAGSAGNLASKPGVGLVVIDEVDKHKQLRGEARTVDLLRQRGKVTVGRKLAEFSTPTLDTGQIWGDVTAGSGHRYFVPCLECGLMQWLKPKQLRYETLRDGNGELDLERVRRETVYECEGCGHGMEEREKAEMMRGGAWRATNFREVKVAGEVERRPRWKPGCMSAYFSDLYAMWEGSSWGDLAVEKIAAKRDPLKLQDLVNGRYGEAFKQGAARRVQVADVLALRGSYKRGEVPEAPVLVTGQADTQDDCWKAVVSGWTARGDHMVSDWGLFLRWQDVLAFFKKGVRHDGRQHMAKFVLVDEGGHRTREVRRLCLPLRPVFFPSKGRGGVQVVNTLDWKKYTVDKGGVEEVDVLTYDDDGFRRLLYRTRILDAGKDPDVPWMSLPAEADPEFARELASEFLVRRGSKWGWETDGANDFGDGVKLGEVAWSACGHLTGRAAV